MTTKQNINQFNLRTRKALIRSKLGVQKAGHETAELRKLIAKLPASAKREVEAEIQRREQVLDPAFEALELVWATIFPHLEPFCDESAVPDDEQFVDDTTHKDKEETIS